MISELERLKGKVDAEIAGIIEDLVAGHVIYEPEYGIAYATVLWGVKAIITLEGVYLVFDENNRKLLSYSEFLEWVGRAKSSWLTLAEKFIGEVKRTLKNEDGGR